MSDLEHMIAENKDRVQDVKDRQSAHEVTLAVIGQQVKVLGDAIVRLENEAAEQRRETVAELKLIRTELQENRDQLKTGRGVLLILSMALGGAATYVWKLLMSPPPGG